MPGPQFVDPNVSKLRGRRESRRPSGRPILARLRRAAAASREGRLGHDLRSCGEFRQVTRCKWPSRFGHRGHGAETATSTFFTERTLAAYLAVSDRTIRNWIRRGRAPQLQARRCRGGSTPPTSRTSWPATGTRRHEAPRAPDQAPQSLRRDRLDRPLHRPRRQAQDRQADLERRQGHLRPKGEAQRAIDEAYGLSRPPRHPRRLLRHLDRAPPTRRNAPTPPTSTGSAESPTWRSRASR